MKTALALAAIAGLFSVAGHYDYQDAVAAEDRARAESREMCGRGTLAYLIDGQACIYENSDGSRVVRYLTPHIGMVSE